MKLLRYLVLADTAFLMLLGFGMNLYLQPFPALYPAAKPDETAATLRVLGVAVGGLAVVVLASSSLSLIGSSRQFARWLSVANILLAAMAGIQQQAIWGSPIGWFLFLIPLVLGAALAWVGWRPLKPGEAAAELSTLQIPEEIRQALLRQIGEAAAQEERNRLARDLHDSIKQQLFSINVGTAAAQERWERDPESARAMLADVRRSAKEAMVEMQALLHQLRPEALTSTGLVEALREQCEALGYRTGAEVALELGEALTNDRLVPGTEETLFRIAQEALSNVARHARARKVRVWLGQEGESALLRVEDDGQGFNPEEETSGMGLRNLWERAESVRGTVEVSSQPGSGTKVKVRIPLAPASPQQWPVIQERLSEEGHYFFAIVMASSIFWLARPVSESDQSLSSVMMIRGVIFTLFAASLALGSASIRSFLERASGVPPDLLLQVRYRIHRNRALSLLVATWWAPWYWRLDQKVWGGVWAIGWVLAALWFAVSAVRELPRLHSVSEPRSWPLRLGLSPSIWSWLAPLLAFAAMALLVQTLPPAGPWMRLLLPSPFTPSEILLLVFGAAILTYVLSRQPRREGAAP